MKNHFVFPALPLLAALALGSCQRPAGETAEKVDRQAEEQRAAVQAAAEALDAERARVEADREALEAEKEEIRIQREAAIAAKERELAGQEADLALRNEEARQAAEALAVEQAEFERREQELDQVELEQAGTTVIADWTPSEPEVVQEPVDDYSLFYDELEPYGDWFETPDYGYVYQPTVVVQSRSWRPYTRGKWVCSNLGWTWRSDEPFGWATFHYGRWALVSGRGWCWVPGSEWAPSWCAWREGGGHVGWAPLPPETLAYRGRGWGANVDVELGIGDAWFNFVESRHMASPLAKHCLPVSRNRHFISATRGCTNLQFQQNRIISGGPSYAALYKVVNRPWPVCLLDLNSVSGIGRGKHAQRHGVYRGNRLELFAPSLDAPWNPRLRPNKVADRWKNVNVVRAESGLQQTWSRRLAQARQRQQENARSWAQKNQDLKESRERQLQLNREKVAAAQARIRENLARQATLREKRKADAQALANGKTTGGNAPGRNGLRRSGVNTNTSERAANTAGLSNGRDRSGRPLPAGVSRGDVKPPFEKTASEPAGVGRGGVKPRPALGSADTRTKTEVPVNDRMAVIRRQQEEARERAAQRAEEAKVRAEQARNVRNQAASNGAGGNAAVAAMKERQEQVRLQREQSARNKATQQAQVRAALQEKVRQQQESNRAAQELAKQDLQRRQQEQREKIRVAQEQARMAQAERARQREEQARQKAVADRQAAEQAARERQAAAQRAAANRAQQQQENARRQEQARQAAQERARQAQERAREAAEQRARQQEQNQQRIREAQERMREKLREQQQRRKK